MKKCPLCAEEIQDQAIKCKHCGSMLGEEAGLGAATAAATAAARAEDATPRHLAVICEVTPRRRALVGSYALTVLLGVAASVAIAWLYRPPSPWLHIGLAAAPVALAALAWLGLDIWRRSLCWRFTNRTLEAESGVLSRHIDVLELWRVRHLQLRQGMVDRILGVATIDVFTQDKEDPLVVVRGAPSRRAVFDSIKEAVQAARQARGVMGIVE